MVDRKLSLAILVAHHKKAVEFSVQKYHDLQKERESQVSECRQQYLDQRQKIQSMGSQDDQLLVRAKERYDWVVAFQDEYYDRMSADVLDKMHDSVTIWCGMQLPKSIGVDLEWTGLDMEPIVSGAGGTDQVGNDHL